MTPEPLVALSGARRALWDSMWASPVASAWEVADVAPLTRLVLLQTTPAALTDPRMLAELRQLEDRFWINPEARSTRPTITSADEGEPSGLLKLLEGGGAKGA